MVKAKNMAKTGSSSSGPAASMVKADDQAKTGSACSATAAPNSGCSAGPGSPAKPPGVQQQGIASSAADAAGEAASPGTPVGSEPGELTLAAVAARAKRLVDLLHPFFWGDRPNLWGHHPNADPTHQQHATGSVEVQEHMAHESPCAGGQQQKQQQHQEAATGQQAGVASPGKPKPQHGEWLDISPYRNCSPDNMPGTALVSCQIQCNQEALPWETWCLEIKSCEDCMDQWRHHLWPCVNQSTRMMFHRTY